MRADDARDASQRGIVLLVECFGFFRRPRLVKTGERFWPLPWLPVGPAAASPDPQVGDWYVRAGPPHTRQVRMAVGGAGHWTDGWFRLGSGGLIDAVLRVRRAGLREQHRRRDGGSRDAETDPGLTHDETP